MRLFEIENGIIAFHGSPYDFTTFSRLGGIGVGGNPYGQGIYFTEIDNAAATYGRIAADDNFRRNLINRLFRRTSLGTKYYVYTVILNVNPDRLINYSVNMNQQSEFVLSALTKIEKELGIDFDDSFDIGKQSHPSWRILTHLEKHLKNKAKASEILLKHGIQGIELKHNQTETHYIIFDPSKIQMFRKDTLNI